MVIIMRKKKIKKEDKKEEKKVLVKEEVIESKEDIGDVLDLVADENNPIGDGLEFKGSD